MQGIFDPRWVYHHRKTVDTAALGYIRISRPDGTKPDWDPETGEVTSPGLYVLYEGKARWQKKGQPTKRDHLQDTANFQRVLVQVSFKEFADWQAENPLLAWTHTSAPTTASNSSSTRPTQTPTDLPSTCGATQPHRTPGTTPSCARRT